MVFITSVTCRRAIAAQPSTLKNNKTNLVFIDLIAQRPAGPVSGAAQSTHQMLVPMLSTGNHVDSRPDWKLLY